MANTSSTGTIVVPIPKATRTQAISGVNNATMMTPLRVKEAIENNTLPLSNLGAIIPPSATDDIVAGYDSGSLWFDNVLGIRWICYDPTASAAKWIPLVAEVGKIAGRYYSLWSGDYSSTTALGAADQLYVYPFRVEQVTTVTSLNCRVVTGAASKNVKMGIWETKWTSGSGYGRPIGPPLAGDNTGQSCAANSTSPQAIVSVTLPPSIYFAGFVCSGTPTFVSGNGFYAENLLGRSATNSTVPLTGLYTSQLYSSNLPTLDGSETWTDVFGGIPILKIGV